MSHEVEYLRFSTNENKKQIERECNNHAERNSDAGGLYKNIRWIDTTFAHYEEAINYLEEHDKGDYDQLAVKFYEYEKIKPSKKLLQLEEKVSTMRTKYEELNLKIHYKGVTSKTVSCKECGSKLSTEYVNGYKNRCPVCGADLRPTSTLERIERAKANYEKARKDYKEEEKKLKEKGKKTEKWLVKIEYHC